MPVTQTIVSDIYGSTPSLPRWVDNMEVAATAVTYTVPAEAVWALITVTAPVWVRVGAEASEPGDIGDGTGSLYLANGIQIRVEGSTTISMIQAGSDPAIASFGLYRQ